MLPAWQYLWKVDDWLEYRWLDSNVSFFLPLQAARKHFQAGQSHIDWKRNGSDGHIFGGLELGWKSGTSVSCGDVFLVVGHSCRAPKMQDVALIICSVWSARFLNSVCSFQSRIDSLAIVNSMKKHLQCGRAGGSLPRSKLTSVCYRRNSARWKSIMDVKYLGHTMSQMHLPHL